MLKVLKNSYILSLQSDSNPLKSTHDCRSVHTQGMRLGVQHKLVHSIASLHLPFIVYDLLLAGPGILGLLDIWIQSDIPPVTAR